MKWMRCLLLFAALVFSSLTAGPFVKAGVSHIHLKEPGKDSYKSILGKSWCIFFGEEGGLKLKISSTTSLTKKSLGELTMNVEHPLTWQDIQISPSIGFYSLSYASKNKDIAIKTTLHSFNLGVRLKKNVYPFYVQADWDHLYTPTLCKFWYDEDNVFQGHCKTVAPHCRINAQIGYWLKKYAAFSIEVGGSGRYLKRPKTLTSTFAANFWF